MDKRKSKGGANLKGSLSSSTFKLESDSAYLIGLADRIRQVRGKTSQEDFARAYGVHVNTLRRYESGKRSPEPGFLREIAKRNQDIDPAWLLMGVGAPGLRGTEPAPYSVGKPQPGYALIPLYEVAASAGGGRVVNGEEVVDVLAFKEDWIRRELRTSPDDLRLIYVEGDSMEPDLRAGDIILIDHTDTTARREGIYVIRMDGALLVKQLQRLPGATVKVISRNASYEPFTVTVSEIEDPNGFAVVGRVVWACRRF